MATTATYQINFTAPSITEAQLKAILDTIVNQGWTIQTIQNIGP